MARPIKSIANEQLTALMRMKPSLSDTAAFFMVSEDTIERHIAREFEMSFAEFREAHMVECRHELIRKAYSMALGGDRAMLALCVKNRTRRAYLNQRRHPEACCFYFREFYRLIHWLTDSNNHEPVRYDLCEAQRPRCQSYRS